MNPTSLIATACAASSRYAAPSLRYGPSGDATQPAATGFGMAGSALPAINDRRLTGSGRPFTPQLNRHKGNRRGSAECGHSNSRVSSAAFIYNNPTTPYFCCQVVQRMGSTSTLITIFRLSPRESASSRNGSWLRFGSTQAFLAPMMTHAGITSGHTSSRRWGGRESLCIAGPFGTEIEQ